MKYLIIFFTMLPAFGNVQERPGLFFREDFKEIPAEIPITQEHLANPDLTITRYGPGAEVIKKSHHDTPADDPFYVWSGLCEGNWAVTLKHRTSDVDLSGAAKIRWRSKQSGFRALRIILRLANGAWLISDASDPASLDWRIREFNLADVNWMTLDIETLSEKKRLTAPDLSRVEEIGWTDLMRGGGTEASSRVDWIEVDGFPKVR